MLKKTVKTSSEGISVVVVSNPDDLLDCETARIRWYLDKYPTYITQGYSLRFPAGINPENREQITNSVIRNAISYEFEINLTDYQRYAEQFQNVWRLIAEKCVPIATVVYGFIPTGQFKIVPTAYGTGGGQLVIDGPIFCRIPKYRTGNRRTEIELIVHEILAHGATAKLRNGTAIDESNPKCTHQWHKERLMDLLGRTFLVRSGMINTKDIKMQDKARKLACADVDPLYYTDSKKPNESRLKYEGKFGDLVRDLDLKLKKRAF